MRTLTMFAINCNYILLPVPIVSKYYVSVAFSLLYDMKRNIVFYLLNFLQAKSKFNLRDIAIWKPRFQ